MLALVLASALVALPEIRVELGTPVTREIETLNRFPLSYGGAFYAEDESIAEVSGTIPARSSRGEARIEGLKLGQTRLMISYLSGISWYREPVATLIVECRPPRIAAIVAELPVRDGEPVTLRAIAKGTSPVNIEWREGNAVLGNGDTLTATLPPGTHPLTVVGENACGTTTAEVEVIVPEPRVDALPEIHVEAGKTIEVEPDTAAAGELEAEHPQIAFVRGRRVDGVRPGTTRMLLVWASALVTYKAAVATIVVDPPCEVPTIAVAESEVRVPLGHPVTLHALTAGTLPLRVEWREGERLLGTGETLTTTLLHGVHNLTAIIQGACGNASADVRVTVFAKRRRAVR